MVLINGVKYACERCIRGHRVTTCTHTDQPLMMIKPKGRPSTTCDHCKELRKNKNANPSGVCTCGRLEKKKLAQKAKEEARAKAKEEKKLHECHCGTNELCKCHSNRRSRTSQSRKLKNNNVGSSISSRPSSQHLDSANIAGTMGHVMSPVSMDSNSSIHNGNTSNSNINGSLNKGESSSLFTSGFLDTREHNGKISKDYHRVPSLASISSLHSGQSASFDQKLGLSQSSLLCGSNNKNNGGNFLNWIDEGKSSYPSRSDSGFNLLDNGKMNSNGMNNGSNNNNNNSNNNNSNNNNNFANDLGIGVYFGVNDGSTNGNENRNENVNWNGNDNVNGVKIMNMNANTNMNTNTTKTENPMDEIPFNEYIEQSNNTNQNQGNNSSAPLSDWNIDKNLDVGSLTSFTQNNGLFDFFLDAPATPSFSKDPLLVQQSKFDNLKENVETQRNVNSNSNYNQNRDSTNTITNVNTNTNTNNTNTNNNNNNNNNSDINKTNVNHNQYRNRTFTNPSVHDRSDALSVDGESIRSVEATPIVQGFMDIPERAPSLQNVHLHQEQHSSNQQQKQARTSPTTNRSFRRQPSGRPPVPVTINPSMVSSIDDAISVTSLQSPVSSLIDNNGVSTSLGNGGDFGNSNIPFERSKSPQFGVLELTNAAMPSSPQSYRQRPNIHPSNVQTELDRLLGFDVGNTSGLMENSAVSESNNSVIHNGNPILRKDTAAFSSPSAKGALEEASLLSSNQETSPPSQLFAEQGFADLDDFMSTL